MGKRQPSIFLAEGKKAVCRYCGIDLTFSDKTFEIKGKGTRQVTEKIMFCPECERYYVTQEMSREILKAHPGYYIDVAQYTLKSKRVRRAKLVNNPEQRAESSIKPPDADRAVTDERNGGKSQRIEVKQESGLFSSPVFLANTPKYRSNVCPKCSSVLSKEKVNIPILKISGDFYRYHTETVAYCNSCKRGYVDKKAIELILKRLQSGTRQTYKVELANVIVQHDSHSLQYLDYPTLDADSAIYVPEVGGSLPSLGRTNEMNLNQQSFLSKMGYAVGENADVRHQILMKAVKLYGKRRVTDHLAFLIDTRRGQLDGEMKYAKAIAIWQGDMKYVFNL